MRAEALADPVVAPAPDHPVVEVGLGGVHRDDRDAVAVELGAALAEQLLEVHVAHVARVVVPGDHDHPLAVDAIEVLGRELVLAAEAVVREVARDHHHVRAELVHLLDRPVEQRRARSAASRSGCRRAGRSGNAVRAHAAEPRASATAAHTAGSRRSASARRSSCASSRSPRSARAHRQVVARGGHVVHPQDRAAPVHHRSRRRPACPRAARDGRPLGDHADEVLARQGEQQRPAERAHLVEAAQHRQRTRPASSPGPRRGRARAGRRPRPRRRASAQRSASRAITSSTTSS